MRHLAKILPVFLLSATAVANAAPIETGAGAGAQIAQRWCVNCHVISSAQTGAVPQGPPSFPTIAKSGMSADQLRAFLPHPHGAMPDLVLTRTEIGDLTAYIQSLR
jgi:mono/diheme cytochrome c family protein